MSKMTRNSFIFYRSFQEAINEASPDEQLQIYRAIAYYALDGTEPQLSGLIKAVWVSIRPQLEANWRRYKNGCKGKEFGNRGGAPMGNSNAQKTTPKQPQDNGKTTPNENVNVNDNENLNPNEKESKGKRNAFSAPSIDEVKSYIYEKGYNVDAESYMAFYESKDWYVGKNKMRNWKAAVLTWHKRNAKKSTTQIQSNERQRQFAEHIITKLNTPDSPEADVTGLY